MKRALTASVWWEREWFVAQCVEAALRNLREALELHFEPPVATVKQDRLPVSSSHSEHLPR